MLRIQELPDTGRERCGRVTPFTRDAPQIRILLHLSELSHFDSIFIGQDISGRLVDGAAMNMNLFVGSSPPRVEYQRLLRWIIVLLSKEPSLITECAILLVTHIKNTRNQLIGGSKVIMTRKKSPEIVPASTDRFVGVAVPGSILKASAERVEEETAALAGDFALRAGSVADFDVLGSIVAAGRAGVVFASFSSRGTDAGIDVHLFNVGACALDGVARVKAVFEKGFGDGNGCPEGKNGVNDTHVATGASSVVI